MIGRSWHKFNGAGFSDASERVLCFALHESRLFGKACAVAHGKAGVLRAALCRGGVFLMHCVSSIYRPSHETSGARRPAEAHAAQRTSQHEACDNSAAMRDSAALSRQSQSMLPKCGNPDSARTLLPSASALLCGTTCELF